MPGVTFTYCINLEMICYLRDFISFFMRFLQKKKHFLDLSLKNATETI